MNQELPRNLFFILIFTLHKLERQHFYNLFLSKFKKKVSSGCNLDVGVEENELTKNKVHSFALKSFF